MVLLLCGSGGKVNREPILHVYEEVEHQIDTHWKGYVGVGRGRGPK